MKKDYTIWKLMGGYLLIIFFLLVCGMTQAANAQTYTCDEDICVVEFNASWNANK